MRYLVDENLSRHLPSLLSASGIEAVHVLDRGLGSASDEEVASFADEGGYCVISSDDDFASMLALTRGVAPSLVLLRSMDRLTPAEQAALLIANLAGIADELAAGAVASVGNGRVRVRRLPIR
jgi:predicted nuclease of predicted toxin-antitoxin system